MDKSDQFKPIEIEIGANKESRNGRSHIEDHVSRSIVFKDFPEIFDRFHFLKKGRKETKYYIKGHENIYNELK